MESNPNRPILIADYFLSKGRPLTPMYVIKIVYMSHGWMLGLFDRPLISETVEAWKYGPVIPSLYYDFRTYGRNPINHLGYCGTSLEDKESIEDRAEFITSKFDQKEKGMMDRMLELYEGYTGDQLSNLTHKKGTPWSKCYVENELHTPIPNDIIRDHYKALSNERPS